MAGVCDSQAMAAQPRGSVSLSVAPTTTLSTIAVKSGENRIVIALLESGTYLTLRIVEMKPQLPCLGDTLEAACQMSDEHNTAIAKLQSKHSPVEEMLRQADSMLAGQKPRAEVYSAMATSLGQAWKTLNEQLELRRGILERNVAFHSRATQLREGLSQLEKEAKAEIPPLRDAEAVRLLLARLQNARKTCLEASVQSLKEGHALLEKLKALKKLDGVDSRPDFMTDQINTAIAQVEHWLENLHDRRCKVEVLWKKRRTVLEQMTTVCVVRKELEELEKAVIQKRQQLLENDSLGESQTSAEYQSLEHQKNEPSIRELRDTAVRVTKMAEKLPAHSVPETDEVKAYAYNLLEQCAELQELFDNRTALLGMAVNFFKTAQTTTTKLDQLDIQLSTSTFSPGSVGLGRLHAQVIRAMEEATAPALHHGYDLLEKTGQTAPGSQGIKRKVEEIERRSLEISSLCTAHKEEAIRNLERVQLLYDQIDEVYSWLTNVAEALIQTHCDLGGNQHNAAEFLELHRQMLNDVMLKGQEIEVILRQLPAIYELVEEPHLTNLQMRFENLKDTWEREKSCLDSRIDLAQTYHRFHTLAVDVKEDLDEIENLVRADADVHERYIATKQKYLQLETIGRNFMADCSKNLDDFLDTQKASLCVEALLEHLEKRFNDVTELLNQRERKKQQEQQLQDRWSKISLDVDSIGQRMKEIANHVFPVITSEISTLMVVSKLEDKSVKFSKDVSALAEEVKIKSNALESFADSDENVKELVNKLNAYNAELSRFSFEVSNLLQMTTKYYRSLVQIDQTIESLEHQYYTTVLPATVPGIELIIRDHVANYNLIANLISKTKSDCDSLIEQYQAIPHDTRQDVDTLMHSLDQRSRHWEAVWQDRNWRLTQHRQHCQFNSDLTNVQNQIDDMLRQIESIKNAGRYASSLTMCKANSDAFSQFERSMETIEPKIQNFVSTAEKIVNSETEESRKAPIESGLNTVTTKWSTLRTSVGETRNVIEMRITYFTLIEEVEEWFTSGSRLLVNLARRSTLCRSKSDADELIKEVETFVKNGEKQQEERMKKISRIAIQLQAPESTKHSDTVLRESREVFESFTSITKELVILSKNLQAAEEEKQQAKVTEAAFRESLAAAQAEAEAARAAARAAEQARIAAEGIAQSMKARPKLIAETTQTDFKTQCDFGSQVSNIGATKRVRLSNVSIQSDEPPLFIETLHDETVTEGQKVTLRCKVSGKPRPEVSWYKDGIAIDNNPDYQTSCIDNECTLRIDETFAEDTAVFTCRAISFAGVAETSCKLTVKEVQPVEELIAPDFSQPLTNMTSREGESVTFRCCITGHPTPVVSWYKNGKCIDGQPEYSVMNENGACTLSIDEVFMEDQGQFICHASNCAGEAECTAMLTVEPLVPSEAPKVIAPLSNVMARAGRKLRLEAKISGKPQPNIVWMHNGRPIKETRELKTFYDGEACTLIITEAFPKDSGTYTVSAKNIAGEASCSSNVTVKGRLPAENSDTEIGLSDIEPTRPSFKVPLKNFTCVEGSRAKLECVVSGQPEPEISWFRNGVLISESSEYQQVFQGDKSSLILRQVRLYDAGTYKVAAINSAGEAVSECQLIVEEDLQPPKFTKLLENLSVKVNSRARFEARLSGKPEPEIVWTKDNVEIQKSPKYSFFNLPDGLYVLEIAHVEPDHEGTYVLSAKNKVGEAKCIAELVVHGPTPPPPPKLDDLMVPPQFEKVFPDTRVHSGTPVAFQCIISGVPDPDIKWLFQGKAAELHPDVIVSKHENVYTFAILVAEPTHTGKVVCVAENSAGVANCTATLTVHEPTMRYQSSLNVKHVSKQMNLEVTEVKETKEEIEVKELLKEIDEGPRLSVRERANLFASQKGIVTENTAPKFHKVQQKQIPPKFTFPLTSCLVEEGARVTMEAAVEGHPLPHISWKFNDKDLVTSDRIKASVDLNHVRLTFLEVMPEDVGQYSCIATNKAGTAVSTAELAIRKPLFPPVIGRRLQPIAAKEGERVHLEIEVTGMPPPEVTWFKNELLIEDPRAVQRTEGARYSITIPKAILSDTGHYRASAENEAGLSESSADVIIFPKTEKKTVTKESKMETRTEISEFSSSGSFSQFSQSTIAVPPVNIEEKHVVQVASQPLLAEKSSEVKHIEHGVSVLQQQSVMSTMVAESSSSVVRMKRSVPKREPVTETARKLDELSKSLSPVPVPGAVRLLPTPTEEKPKPSFKEERQMSEDATNVEVKQKKLVEFKFASFEELEPFPFTPEPPKPRPPKGPPLRKPSKFVKGESRESDYESDLESRFPVKWVPPGSDTEGEPAYQKIKLDLKERRKKRREEKQKSPTPPTEFDVPPVIEAPPRPKIDLVETVNALRQASSRESSIARSLTPLSSRSLDNLKDDRKFSASPKAKQEALEMEKKWVPKKPSVDVIMIKQPIVHSEERPLSVSPLPSHEALQMEKQWGKKMGDMNVVWPPPSDEPKKVIPWKKDSAGSSLITSCETNSTSSFTRTETIISSTMSTMSEEKKVTETVENKSDSNWMSIAVVGQPERPPVNQEEMKSIFEQGFLVGLKASDNKISVIKSSATGPMCHHISSSTESSHSNFSSSRILTEIVRRERSASESEGPMPQHKSITSSSKMFIGAASKEHSIAKNQEPPPQSITQDRLKDHEEKTEDGTDGQQSEVVTESYGGLNKMKALWESKLHQETRSHEEVRTVVKHQLVSKNEEKLTANQQDVVNVAPPVNVEREKTPPTQPGDFRFEHEVTDFHATVTHARPLMLEPFPFVPDPPRPKKEKLKYPPPTKPKKFIKGEFRESDYESDYEGRIKPKWAPSDSETEELVYRSVRPRLQSRESSRHRKGRSPTPPSVFETPPEITGQCRPVINLEERIHPEGQEAEPVLSPQRELIVSPPPPTSKQVLGALALANLPTSRPLPTPPPELPRPSLPTVGVETTQRMKMEESTASSRRFVSVEQTTRVIKLEPPSEKVLKPFSPRGSMEVVIKPQDPDSDDEGERKRKQRQEELVLEPFPFVPEPVRPRPPKGNLPPIPKKFVKGESKESDYESDFESVRFRPKWVPAGSDTEEPSYRKVRPPAVPAQLQQRLDQMGQRSPTPPTVFDEPPVFDGPPRPKITEEDVKNLRDLLVKEGYSQASSIAFIESIKAGKTPIKIAYRKSNARPVFTAPPPPSEDPLAPGDPPEYGYTNAKAAATGAVASHFEGMSNSIRSRFQEFSDQIASKVKGTKLAPPPSPPVPETLTHQKQVQFSDIPSVKILEPSSDATEDSCEPHAYKEESRVSEFGTKHIDPDSGLIYFKYDFGYEFGIVMPGEPIKVDKIEIAKREGDINVPIIHEKSPRRESPQSVRRSPKQSPPSKRASRHKPMPSESEVSDTEKAKVPNFKPRKITHAKPARWEPMSESEISELESTLERRGPSRYYKERKCMFNRFEPGEQRERSVSPISISPSVSPYPLRADSVTSTPCDAGGTTAPLIVVPLRDVHALIGREIWFECVAAGDWLNFEWSKDGNVITPSVDYIISNKQVVSQLSIPEVFPEDTGCYTCRVWNPFGSASSTANLQVEGDKL